MPQRTFTETKRCRDQEAVTARAACRGVGTLRR